MRLNPHKPTPGPTPILTPTPFPAVLACSLDGSLVAFQEFQLLVSVSTQPAGGDSPNAQQLTAPPLMLSVMSGPPAHLGGSIGDVRQVGSLGLNQTSLSFCVLNCRAEAS